MDVPYRSTARFKGGNALHNNNPVKLGEQEYFNLALLEDPAALDKFLKMYSSSKECREAMLHQLLTSHAGGIEAFDPPEDVGATATLSNSAQAVRAMFKGIGVTISND